MTLNQKSMSEVIDEEDWGAVYILIYPKGV